MTLSRDDTKENARKIALAICDEGQAATLGVVACDDGSALVTTRAGLVEAVREIVARVGLHATSDPLDATLAQITAVPAWKVPCVLWIGDEIRVAEFVPTRGVS